MVGHLEYLNVGQDEYVPWINTAGFAAYVHNQSDGVYAESVNYKVAPGYHTTIGLQWVSRIR